MLSFRLTASVSPPHPVESATSRRKILIHRHLFAVRIQIAFCQLHGFSYHDTQSHRFDFQICGNLYRISNEVSVMNKCLYRQFGIIPSDILFTLCTGIKDDAPGFLLLDLLP